MTVSSVAQLGAYGGLVIPGNGPDGSLPALVSRLALHVSGSVSGLAGRLSAPARRAADRAAAGDLTAAIEARATRADYQLFVCAVRGAATRRRISTHWRDKLVKNELSSSARSSVT
jgi:hypothetical protein